MNQFGASVGSQPVKHEITIAASADTCPDFDQFMIIQSLAEFADDARGQAALSNQNERVQAMPESPQVFLLTLRECHHLIIGLQPGVRS